MLLVLLCLCGIVSVQGLRALTTPFFLTHPAHIGLVPFADREAYSLFRVSHSHYVRLQDEVQVLSDLERKRPWLSL